jgi:hypothetical protein
VAAAWWPSLAIGAALATVTGTTGFVSYTHISALSLELHQSWKTAHLMPVFIDGQIVIGSVFYMVIDGWKRLLGLLGVVPGLAESVFANWESGIAHGLRAAAWATVAAQAFAVSSFLFERWLQTGTLKRGRGGQPPLTVPAASTLPVGCGHGVADSRAEQARDAYLHLRDCWGGNPSYRGIGAAFDTHHDTVRQLVMAADGEQPAGADQGPAPAELTVAAS